MANTKTADTKIVLRVPGEPDAPVTDKRVLAALPAWMKKGSE